MNKQEKNEHDFEELYIRIRTPNNKINQSEFTFMKRRLKEDIKNGKYDSVILTLFDDYMKIRNHQLLEVYEIADSILNIGLDDSIDNLLKSIDLFNEFTVKTLDIANTFSNGDKMIEQREMCNVDYNFIKELVDDMNLILLAYSNGMPKKLKPSIIESKNKCAYTQLVNECLKVVNYLYTNLVNEYEAYVFSELFDLQTVVFKQNTAIQTELMTRIKTMSNNSKKQMVEDTIEKSKKLMYTDNYKKLNTILKSKDYIEVRQRGSHKIFSNGTHSIPIPQHNIGKGLFSQIRKEANL